MRTRARCSRNSPLALWSLGGLVPSAARSAAVGRVGAGRERLLDAARPHGDRPHVRERDAGVSVLAHRGDGDRRPVLRPPVELLVRPAGAPRLGNADLGQHLLRVECRLEEASEALGDGQAPLAPWAADDELRVEGEENRGRVRGGIAVRDRAADRAAVANLRVADEAGRLGDDRALGPQELALLDVPVAREGADRDRVPVVLDVGEVGDPADVDEQLGPREPQPHEREQRVAAGDELGLLA